MTTANSTRNTTKVTYTWVNNTRGVTVRDSEQGIDSGYNEDAADFIMTGDWGALDPEQNQHLIVLRDRFVKLVEKDLAMLKKIYG